MTEPLPVSVTHLRATQPTANPPAGIIAPAPEQNRVTFPNTLIMKKNIYIRAQA